MSYRLIESAPDGDIYMGERALTSESVKDILRESHSVFTTFKIPIANKALQRHLKRLENNAKAMSLPFDWRLEALEKWLLEALSTNFTFPCVIRLTALGNAQKGSQKSEIKISSRPLPIFSSQGLSLKSVQYEKPFPTIKYGRLSESFALRDHAQSHGADDALWINLKGHVTESTTANIWGIKTLNNHVTLYTPDSEIDGCLPGITREQIMEHAEALGIPVVIGSISLEEALSMDALFLSNAVIGLTQVRSLNDTFFTWSEASNTLYKAILNKLENLI